MADGASLFNKFLSNRNNTLNNNSMILQQEKVLKRFNSGFKKSYGVFHKVIFHKFKLNKILNKIPLFDSQSNKKLFMDLLYCFCSLMFYFSIPLHVSFNKKISEFISSPLLTISWLVILLHILVTLNTCYYEKGLLVNSRSKIFHNYL